MASFISPLSVVIPNRFSSLTSNFVRMSISPKPSSPSASSALVSPSWLREKLSSLRVIDASWYLSSPGKSLDEFQAGRIPGAVFLDIDDDTSDFCAKGTSLPHMLPSIPDFEKAAIEKLKIFENDQPVVVYTKDSPAFCASARVWWMLRTFGLTNVRVLNGGMKAWIEAGYEIIKEEEKEEETKEAKLKLTQRKELIKTLPDILNNDGSMIIIDARPSGRFHGLDPEPRKGLRGGHMPGALNVPANTLIDQSTGKLKEREQLISMFSEAGLNIEEVKNSRGARVTTSCGSGVTASVLALALHELGVDAAVYDGSWAEYGASEDNPIDQ